MTIELAPLPTDEVRALVGELEQMLSADYECHQRHGLSIDGIFQPHVRFFIARADDGTAIGCGGVASFDGFAEVKRMYVRPAFRGRGFARALLARIEAEARELGHTLLRLETGDRLFDAMRLYERAGFHPCPAFGEYAAMEPHRIEASRFYEKILDRTLQ